MVLVNRNDCERRDECDPLAPLREEFVLPPGVIYLDGNSLGALPRAVSEIAHRVVEQEWGQGLIRSWNSAGWFDLPARLGAKLAPMVGADSEEVLVTDSTCINLYKVMAAALAMRSDRLVIVMEGSNFPTDNYMVQGLIGQLPGHYEIRFAERDTIFDAIDDDVAVVCLTQVHYKWGHLLDMLALTARAHAVGALTIWDLCHSAGAMPVDLNGCNADFAIGCTYKYLNGGPGSPAFLFAAKRHHEALVQPLSGWWGHAEPFAFERDYRAADGIARMLTSTQPILSMAICEAGLDIAARVDLRQVREKSLALGQLFDELVEGLCPDGGFTPVTPREPSQRGSQVALAHRQGYPIMQALITGGVIGDFRAPNILRFGFSPLYVRYVDVFDAVTILADIMCREVWREPQYHQRSAVT